MFLSKASQSTFGKAGLQDRVAMVSKLHDVVKDEQTGQAQRPDGCNLGTPLNATHVLDAVWPKPCETESAMADFAGSWFFEHAYASPELESMWRTAEAKNETPPVTYDISKISNKLQFVKDQTMFALRYQVVSDTCEAIKEFAEHVQT